MKTAPRKPVPPQQPGTVKPVWILGAFGIMLALAAVCAYLSLCLLFYQGQWQLLFRPSSTVNNTPASVGLAYEEVRYDTPETGVPRLDGWWLPGDPGVARTVLYLHSGDGSLSDTLPTLVRLYRSSANVLAFDYRGYGKSAPLHPSEQSMLADVDASLAYLESLRHIPAATIVLYGQGVGGTIAAEAAARHAELRSIILEDLNPPALTTLKADPRTGLLPVRLLMTSPLDPTHALRQSTASKLFVGGSPQEQAVYRQAAEPKTYVATADSEALKRFLESH